MADVVLEHKPQQFPFEDLSDREFVGWKVLRRAAPEQHKKGGQAYWLCECKHCGRVKPVASSSLRKGGSLSCGCQRNKGRKRDLTAEPPGSFGRWKVLRPGKGRKWVCECQCPLKTIREVFGPSLTGGLSTSCGCVKSEKTRERFTKHGMSHTPTWRIWWDMIARCYYPSNSNYERYGGRGIRVCARWLGEDGFANFHADMGERPDDHSIDRTDNNGHYTPGNCTWQTRTAQMANTRRSHYLTLGERTLTVAGWGRETGIPSGTILYRLKAGWTVEDALTTPVREMEACVLTHAGKTQTLTEWAEELGVPYQTLYARINRKLAVWQVLAEAGVDGPDTADVA